MVLARHARDPNGRLLLREGEEITANHIRTFKAWGITELDIEGPQTEDNSISEAPILKVPNQEVSGQVKEDVDELFRYTDRQHPAIKELVELCTLRKMNPH